MADTATGTIEVNYYDPAPESGIAYRDVWKITKKGTGEPVTLNVTDIYISITQGKNKLVVDQTNGLTWNEADRSVKIEIKNDDLYFIKDDIETTYECWVAWETGELQRIRYGAVTAARVD